MQGNVAVITVVNVLSGLRLGLAATFPFVEHRYWFAMIAAAAVSDYIDGELARRFNAATWIGGLLDAVADKAMILSVLVSMTLADYFEWWQVAALLSRDLTVAFIAAYAVAIREWSAFRKMPSRPLGKWTTAAVLATFLLALLTPEREWKIDDALLVSAVGLSVAAAMDYLRQFLVELRAWRIAREES